MTSLPGGPRRSSLDLLDLDFVFSQHDLLTAEQFTKELLCSWRAAMGVKNRTGALQKSYFSRELLCS